MCIGLYLFILGGLYYISDIEYRLNRLLFPAQLYSSNLSGPVGMG